MSRTISEFAHIVPWSRIVIWSMAAVVVALVLSTAFGWTVWIASQLGLLD
jgi:hypothetical protein